MRWWLALALLPGCYAVAASRRPDCPPRAWIAADTAAAVAGIAALVYVIGREDHLVVGGAAVLAAAAGTASSTGGWTHHARCAPEPPRISDACFFVAPDLAVVRALAVAGADTIEVELEGTRLPATLHRLSLDDDLALLDVPGAAATPSAVADARLARFLRSVG